MPCATCITAVPPGTKMRWRIGAPMWMDRFTASAKRTVDRCAKEMQIFGNAKENTKIHKRLWILVNGKSLPVHREKKRIEMRLPARVQNDDRFANHKHTMMTAKITRQHVHLISYSVRCLRGVCVYWWRALISSASRLRASSSGRRWRIGTACQKMCVRACNGEWRMCWNVFYVCMKSYWCVNAARTRADDDATIFAKPIWMPCARCTTIYNVAVLQPLLSQPPRLDATLVAWPDGKSIPRLYRTFCVYVHMQKLSSHSIMPSPCA